MIDDRLEVDLVIMRRLIIFARLLSGGRTPLYSTS
jgi:hypothetical protein